MPSHRTKTSASPARRTEVGRAGAAARTAALSPARRTEIARIAAQARWTPTSPEERSRSAQAAAKARWHDVPTDVEALTTEVRAHRDDLARAAGTCSPDDDLIELPTPGTNLAFVVRANNLLRQENAQLLGRAADAEASLRAAEALLRDVLAGIQRDRTVSLLTERRLMAALDILPASLKDEP